MTIYPTHKFSNGKIATLLLCLIGGMIVLSFASVPLYNWFCRVTGIAGTPQITTQYGNTTQYDSVTTGDETLQISFDANIDASLNWEFVAAETIDALPIGEVATIYYNAKNLGAEPSVGRATFNITPLKAGKYFYKIECFCFSEQPLAPLESVGMPVQFYIDPAIADDKNMRDVKAITLSYTMYDFNL